MVKECSPCQNVEYNDPWTAFLEASHDLYSIVFNFFFRVPGLFADP